MRLRLPFYQRPPKESFVSYSALLGHLGLREPIVGEWEVFGETYIPRYGGEALVIHRRPVDTRPWGADSRLFQVTDIKRLMRGSFTAPNWPDTGYCQSYLVAEEIPLARAYGPHGDEVLALVGAATRMSAPEIIELGERALPDLTRRVYPRPQEIVAETGLGHAWHEASTRVDLHFTSVAYAFDTDGIAEERQGCERYLELVHPVWVAAYASVTVDLLRTMLGGVEGIEEG